MRTPPFFARLLHVLALILLSGLFVLGTGCVHNNDPWYDDPPPPRHHRQPPPPHNRVQPNKPAPPAHVAPRPARTPPSRPLRHAAERAMIPDLPGNAAPARPVPGGMSGMPSA